MALSIEQINKLEQKNAEFKALSEELGKIIECKNGTIATLAKTRNELKAGTQILSDELDKYKSVVLKQFEEIERLKALLDVLEEDNKKLSKENDVFYNNSLQEVKEDLVKRVWNLQTENKELALCLQEIKKIAEELSCKHPEECFENKPDWNGEVYGCDVADNWKNPSELATCPSKLASAILQIITKAEEE